MNEIILSITISGNNVTLDSVLYTSGSTTIINKSVCTRTFANDIISNFETLKDITLNTSESNTLDPNVASALTYIGVVQNSVNHYETDNLQADWNQTIAFQDDFIKNKPTIPAAYSHPNHSGDVTSVGDGAQTISNNAVSNAKLSTVAQNVIKGRITTGTGNVEDLSAANVRTIINVADGANNYSHPNHSGDVTSSGDGAQTIANKAVTYAKVQDVTANRLLGRVSTDGSIQEITLGTSLSFTGTTLNATPGTGEVSSVNTKTGAVVLTPDDLDDSLTTHKFTTATEISKLSGIEAGAEVNVQADWNQASSSADDYIKNKPTIPAAYSHPNHSGDVTSVGDGAQTIANNVVSNAKLSTVAQNVIKGRITTGAGNVEDLSAANVRTIINVADGANNYSHPNHSGDVTSVADGAQTIASKAVTYSKIQDVTSTSRVLGRISTGAGVIEELTGANIRTIANVADGANNYSHPNHSGDVTSVGDGAQTIAAKAVSYSKIQDVAASRLLGRSNTIGAVEEITLGTNLSLTGTTLNAASTPIPVHNDLSSLQGGQAAEYYHMKSAEYTDLQALLPFKAINGQDTGWDYSDETKIDYTYDYSTRTVSITGTAKFYYQGKLKYNLTGNPISFQHTTDDGKHYILWNNLTSTWVEQPDAWTFDQGQLATVYYNLAAPVLSFCIREPHSFMDRYTHEEAHDVNGTYKKSGTGKISGYVANSIVPTERRPTIATTTIKDEDVPTIIAALPLNGPYTKAYLLGNPGVFTYSIDNTEIIYESGVNPQYNQLVGGTTWQLTTITTNNTRVNYYVLDIPVAKGTDCQKMRRIIMPGQKTYTSLAAAQAEDPKSLFLGSLQSLSAEFCLVSRCTIVRQASGWRIEADEELDIKKGSMTSLITGGVSITTSSPVSGDGTTGNPVTIAAGDLTNTSLANMAQNTIKGRITTGTGVPEDLSAANVRTIINVADGANNYVHPNHSGDVTSVADGAQTIASNVVTNAKLAQIATNTIKGRISLLTGDVEDLSAANVRAIINVADGANNYVHPNHSGDVTSVADGAQTIAAKAVTYSKIQDISASKLLGRSNTIGAIEEITLGTNLSLTGTTLNAAASSYTHPNHSGDVTSVGDGAQTIASKAVTYAKIQDITATNRILGRISTGSGVTEELTAANVRTIINVADGANNYSHPNHSGDVTSVGDGAQTIANAAVSLAKMANLAQNTIIGRISTGAGVPEALSAANVRTIINVADGANNYSHPNHSGDVTSVADGAQTIASNAVSDAKFRQSAGLSIVGRSANTTGNVADITAVTDGHILRLSGTSIGFGQIVTAGLTDANVTYAKIQNVSTNNRLLGRATSGAGVVEEITLGNGLTLTGSTLNSLWTQETGYINSIDNVSVALTKTFKINNVNMVKANAQSSVMLGDTQNTTMSDTINEGTRNLLAGYQAGKSLTTANHCVALGPYSLTSNQTQNFNTGIGYATLFNLITGTGNFAMGQDAGRYFATNSSLTSATDCIFVGRNSKASANAVSNEIVIGADSLGLGSNTTVIGKTTHAGFYPYGIWYAFERTAPTVGVANFHGIFCDSANNGLYSIGEDNTKYLLSAWRVVTGGIYYGTAGAQSVGVGVQPELWQNVFNAVQVGQTAAFFGQPAANAAYFTNNVYFNAVWKSLTAGYASRLGFDSAGIVDIRTSVNTATVKDETMDFSALGFSLDARLGVMYIVEKAAAPALKTGMHGIYASTNGNIYSKNSSGTEFKLNYTHPNHSGDVTSVADGAQTIANNAVSDAKFRQSVGISVVGRSANSTGNTADIVSSVDGTVLRLSGTTLGFGTLATAAYTDASVTYAKIQNLAGLSVVGRSANSTGVSAAITAVTDGHVLRLSGTSIGFGTIATAGITDAAVTYAKIQNVSAGDRLLGRVSSAGVVQELSCAAFTFSGTAISMKDSKAITVVTPSATGDGAYVAMFHTTSAITLTKCRANVYGAGSSVQFSIISGTTFRTGITTNVSSQTANAGGTDVTRANDAIAAGSVVWIQIVAVTGTAQQINVTLEYTM